LQRYDTCSSVVLKKTFFYATIHSSYCIFWI
jgi:hypothetical protein